MVMCCTLAIVSSIIALSCTLLHANDGGSLYSMMTCEESLAPRFVGSAESSNSMKNCEFAMLQGHRDYQEDRVACNLELKLPFSGEGRLEDTTIGIAAIFDGHGGDEASEMASAMLSNSFMRNVVFAAYKLVLSSNEGNKSHCSPRRTEASLDHHSLRLVLEEALVKTIDDIDSKFSKVASQGGYISGSTGVIVLLFEGQLLVANVGDSKALLCSKKVTSHHDNEGAFLKEVHVEELTRDHHPDREDEKARIKAAGGFITRYGVPRVNGMLALSRAIGDIYLKRYGVTAEAEITGWRAFTPEDSYLVVASDGVFETLTTKNVCELLHEKASEFSSQHVSLPEWIIRHAFRTGSTDNLSAIVISHLAREKTDPRFDNS